MRIPNFTWTGGVIDSELDAHVDLNKYLTGLRKLENFRINNTGGVEKRGGLRYINTRKFDNKRSRLVPWFITADDSYMLEFGEYFIRFIRFGSYVLFPGGSIVPPNAIVDDSGYMEIVTPYTAEEVWQLKFTSANDILYINHGLHQERQLKRLGLINWTFELTSFNPHGTAPTGLTCVWERNAAGVWQTASMDQPSYDENPEDYSYKISATMADGLETIASDKVTVSADLGYPGFRVKITWTALAGAVQYTIYKGKAGIFGFIGYVQATDPLEFMDRNFAPSYDVTPIVAFTGFPTDEWPSVSEFYKQRKVYAALPSKQNQLNISRPLYFNSMSTSIPTQDDDAIMATLVGRNKHIIYHMLEFRVFMIFTSVAEWILKTANNQAMSPATVDPVIETNYGSHQWLAPIPVGERVLMVQSIGNAILDIGYALQSDHYLADDLTKLCMSMVRDKGLVAHTYANAPYNKYILVYEEPTISCMTYNRQHEIWGWYQERTAGKYLDAASVAEGSANSIYYQVERTIDGVKKYFIEREVINRSKDIRDQFYLDCGLSAFDGKTFTAFSFLSATTGIYTALLTSETVNDIYHLIFSDGREFRVQITDIDVDLFTVQLYEPTDDTVLFSGDLDGLAGATWRCSTTFSGFSHLANSVVTVLADGWVERNIVVSPDGIITIPFYAFKIHAGFEYESYLETLNLDVDRFKGQYMMKAVTKCITHLKDSYGLEFTAVGSDDWQELPNRDEYSTMDSPPPPLNGVFEITVPTVNDFTVGLKIRSQEPLPATILTAIPDIEYES